MISLFLLFQLHAEMNRLVDGQDLCFLLLISVAEDPLIVKIIVQRLLFPAF